MPAQSHASGPGRSTADAAFDEVKKEIERRNDQVHKAARQERTAREQKPLAMRRERD